MFTKTISTIVLIMLFASLQAQPQTKTHVPGEVLVKLEYEQLVFPQGRPSALLNEVVVKSQQIRNTLAGFGVDSIYKVVPQAIKGDTLLFLPDGMKVRIPDFSQLFKFTFSESIPVDTIVKKFNGLPQVIYAEPNHKFYPTVDPNDDFYGDGYLWHLKQTSDEDVDADLAWDINKGDGIKIAIMDWGVRITHDDIDGKITGGETTRSLSHGTMVSGVAAAETNNALLTSGVAWNSQIIPYNFAGNTDNLVSDMYSAVSAGANIINMSFGSEAYNQSFKDALDNALAHGIILVGSAGNAVGSQGSSPPYNNFPATYNNLVIGVTATNSSGNFVSNWNYGSFVDVCAPGYQIYTLDWDSDTDWAIVDGTSFSAPIVSGIGALLKSYKPELTDRDIERIIELSSEDKGAPGWDNQYGYGRVNAYNALQLVSSPNVLYHRTATGGSTHSSASGHWSFYDLPGGAPNEFYVGRRYEVRKSVSFDKLFKNPPEVWGRVVGTTGYCRSEDYTSNYSIGYCEPVPGTITTTGAVLRTYVYRISLTGGQYYDYYPCQPGNVTFAYSVLGELDPLSVTITGPTYLNYGQTGTFTANPSGGSGTYTNYRWWTRNDEGITMGGITPHAPPSGEWIYMSSWEGQQTVQKSSTYDFSLKCEVTDSDNNTATDIHSVDVGPFLNLPGGPGQDEVNSLQNSSATANIIPEELILENNYPNPFNPTTTIRFGLPQDQQVNLSIYSITGEKVATLVENFVKAGFHEITWDGRNQNGTEVSSGVYVYMLQASNEKVFKKMMLVR
jgi:hypothetical protein